MTAAAAPSVAPAPPRTAAIPWYVIAVLVAATSAVLGVMWDISWHRTIGRDTFWTPAHLAIYLGGVLAGVSSGWLVLKTTFAGTEDDKAAGVSFWGFRGPLGAWVAIWGTIAMITSAPFDNWWHNAYGLDVKVRSPPHVILAAGTWGIKLGALVLVLGLQNRAAGGARPRVMMNAELIAGGQHRIIIPTVYRDDYLGALRGLSRNGRAEVLSTMLDRAQSFSSRIDLSDLAGARRALEQAQAFLEPSEGQDADLLGLQAASADELMRMFRDIALASTADDGLVFDPQWLGAVEIAEQEDSPGVRLTLRASLDRAVIPLQIDVAFGQAVVPEPEVIQLPTLLNLPAPRLKAYPPEAVVAEKFEAVVKLGMINSRLKDFYDLWYILVKLGLPLPQLAAAVSATFTRRGTPLPRETPAALTSAFSADPSRQRQWTAFLDRAGIAEAPRPTLDQVTAAILDRLLPVVRQAREKS